MRFRSQITNIKRFTQLAASLGSLGKTAWLQLDSDQVRFTVIPEQGSQVWALLSIETIFDDYTIVSAAPNNVINLEVPIQILHRALKSALGASATSIRLTKKNDVPVLCLTITLAPFSSSNMSGDLDDDEPEPTHVPRDRETVVTQDVAVRVLAPKDVEELHEPRCEEPDVHITLPPLLQMKSISERFLRLAATSKSGSKPGTTGPMLELAANMYGSLKLSLATDAMSITSVWTGLTNPELNQDITGDIENHPSTRMKQLGEEGWAKVRIDGRDWARVLSIGRIGGNYIACIVNDKALILYVYLPSPIDGDDSSVLTYYINSYLE